MTPLEALVDAIGMTASVLVLRDRRFPNPGDVIKKMGSEHREALSRLTSEDTQKLRMDLFWNEGHESRCRFSAMLLEFDRKLIS